MAVSSSTQKILIIDDEISIIELISDILERGHYQTIGVTKWTEAIDAINHEEPDLILLDLKMPTITGASILEFIRQEGIDLPVIVVSGFVTDEVEEDLRRMGVDGIIRKPFQVDQLRGEIQRVIGPARDSEAARPTQPPQPRVSREVLTSIDELYQNPLEPAPEPDAPPSEPGKEVPSIDLLYSAPSEDLPDLEIQPRDLPEEDTILNILQKLNTGSKQPAPAAEVHAPAETTRAPEPPPKPNRSNGAQSSSPAPEQARTLDDITPGGATSKESIFGPESVTRREPDFLTQPQRDAYRPRRRHSSRSERRQTLKHIGWLSILCILVAGFLALMQWYADKIDVERMKANVQKSVVDQAKEEFIKEKLKELQEQ